MVLQSCSWCFTLNNYTPSQIEHIIGLEGKHDIIHCIFGREVSESGTPHLQGFIRFSKKKRLGGVKKMIADEAHVEVARNPVAAVQYCKKDGDYTEFGSWESQQGKRSDLYEIIENVQEGNTEAHWWITNYPETWHGKSGFIKDCINNLREKPKVIKHSLRHWQAQLWKWLSFKPDDRHILFVVDETGGYGKSWFALYYHSMFPDNTQVLTPAKGGDLAYAYKVTNRVLFMDAPRSRSGAFFPYAFLEHVKNGHLFSNKYDSGVKMFTPPHVVVFMNHMPDLTQLSYDRYLIRILEKSDNSPAMALVKNDLIDKVHKAPFYLPRDDLRRRDFAQEVHELRGGVLLEPEIIEGKTEPGEVPEINGNALVASIRASGLPHGESVACENDGNKVDDMSSSSSDSE